MNTLHAFIALGLVLFGALVLWWRKKHATKTPKRQISPKYYNYKNGNYI